MLRELLTRTQATVHCLVRAPDMVTAAERIRGALVRYRLWDESLAPRIVPVLGDLAAPRLGLGDAVHDLLARRLDAIYHVGAAVNLVYPYEVLRPATVDGTREVLRLATATGRAPVHHVSTVGVFAGVPAHGGPIAEDDPAGPPELLRQGYTQSKWVAERLVELAGRAGVPVTVHRPARIAGHSLTGACQTDDFLWRVVKGCVEAGACPAASRILADLVPVDYVAASIVGLSLRPEALGGVYHQVNPRPIRLGQIMEYVREFGHPVAEVTPERWLSLIRQDPGNAAYPLLSVFESAQAGGFADVFHTSPATDAALAGSGITCPALDAPLFHAHLAYFAETGFLPAPVAHQVMDKESASA